MDIATSWVNDKNEVTFFQKNLIEWGSKNFRDFPWRSTKDPYKLLIAEIMLHRTQAKQVVPVYEEFVRKFDNILTLATARKSEIQNIMYSLGLNWRIDLVKEMAIVLESKFDGKVPKNRESLLSLPGVSDYITSAVRCFAWNLPEPLSDTNTVRIISRIFGLEAKDSSRRSRLFLGVLETLVSRTQPREYNFAILDLGSIICHKRRSPECHKCPLREQCIFGLSKENSQRTL